MPVPNPTPIYRLTHVDNLAGILQRGGMYAPNHAPEDGIGYRAIHHQHIQGRRVMRRIPCGPGGTIHDYVPFYFGPRPPMLLALRDGYAAGYNEGQGPLIYLVLLVQDVAAEGLGFVFTDGHGIMVFTAFYDDLSRLDEVDWQMVTARYWADTDEDPDRKRRKQAEFLIDKFCPWALVRIIGVMTAWMQQRVEEILDAINPRHRPVVQVKRG
jgi:hypothetical protein